MSTFNEKLKAARLAKSLTQADVAEKLNSSHTSFTNWESGKTKPPLDVLSRLCKVYEISPLSLLEQTYTDKDIADILLKDISDRTYEENVALNFAPPLLVYKDAIKAEVQQNTEKYNFIRSTNLITRFGGSMDGKQIEAIMSEYEKNGEFDSDILFAFHSLASKDKDTFISVLRAFFWQYGQNSPISSKKAFDFTYDRIIEAAKKFRQQED